LTELSSAILTSFQQSPDTVVAFADKIGEVIAKYAAIITETVVLKIVGSSNLLKLTFCLAVLAYIYVLLKDEAEYKQIVRGIGSAICSVGVAFAESVRAVFQLMRTPQTILLYIFTILIIKALPGALTLLESGLIKNVKFA
jgi:hypothetical protein